MQVNSAPSAKPIKVYNAFLALKQQGHLNTLDDAEKLLLTFGTTLDDRNVIKFDLEVSGDIQNECLYEYNIPLGNRRYATFYVDQHLGFECGERFIRE